MPVSLSLFNLGNRERKGEIFKNLKVMRKKRAF